MNSYELKSKIGEQELNYILEMGFSTDQISQAYPISIKDQKNIVDVLLEYL